MRIAWRTKWGLPGGYKCRATGALDEAGKSSLVSGGAEMWRNSISYHPALYIANCLFWKARKKNFQLFRALKPQPTSWVGWGTWLLNYIQQQYKRHGWAIFLYDTIWFNVMMLAQGKLCCQQTWSMLWFDGSDMMPPHRKPMLSAQGKLFYIW